MSVHKESKKQEERTAKSYRGSRNAMSGAGWVRKADVRTEDFMIENKLKMNPLAKSYSLRVVDLRDLVRRARMEGRIPLMQIDLAGNRYVVIPEDDFLDIISSEEDSL